MANLVGPNCIIQGDFGSGNHKNLEAVLFRDGQLHHLFGAPTEDRGVAWVFVQTLPSEASGPGSIIQSGLDNSVRKDFEVVLWAGNELWHWFHDNFDFANPWQRVGLISDRASGPGSIIQSDFGEGGRRNFEVVAIEGNNLVHYFRNNADVESGWQQGQTISTRATGPGCIIQSDFIVGGHGRLEVAVLEANELVHYFHDGARWIRAGVITTNATGPGSIIQGGFGSQHRNFEVVVPERHQLVHYFFDHSHPNRGWQRGQVISVAATGPGCIAKSDFGPGGPGNFEVLASELSRSVVHYWHHNVDATLPWWRRDPLPSFGEPVENSRDFRETKKVAQLTGETDRQRKRPTLNRTESRFGVVGTDLGQSFEHAGRVVFLFGDTKTDGFKRPEPTGVFDSIAFTSDTDPDPVEGIRLDFNPTFPFVENIDQGGFCVPADGISINGRMYVFFTTDHVSGRDTNDHSMGRSVLARSDDGGIRFGRSLYDLSRDKFINVSLQQVANTDFPGLPDGEGDGVLIWGSGGYRRSNVYLAYVPLARFEDRSAYRFFVSLDDDGMPQWSSEEGRAEPLFLSGSVGELCVRWNPFLRRFILLYNSNNPPFILARQAAFPWGPWSSAQNIFDWEAALKPAPGAFIHKKGEDDGLGDGGPDQGSAYAPYLISRYTRPITDGVTEMFFVLSVWNPYNTMLMKGIFRVRELPGSPATRQSAHSGPFTQSTFGRQGNFELVVPQGSQLVHYFRDNDAPGFPWHRFGTLPGFGGPRPAFRPFPISASLIQGRFGAPGNFELIARMRNVTNDNDFLVFYFFDSKTLTWHGPTRIVADGQPIDGVTGNPAFIQSEFGRQGNFELLVPQHGGLVHYFRANDEEGFPWHRFATIRSVGGPLSALKPHVISVALLESNFSAPGSPGNLEAIVRMRQVTRNDDFLVAYFFDINTLKWNGSFNVVADGEAIGGVTGDPAFLQGTFGRKGDFELIVPQGNRLVHYFRDNDADGLPWRKSGAIIPNSGGPHPGFRPVPTGVALIQSNFNKTGNLEAVVRTRLVTRDTDSLAFQIFDSRTLTWSPRRKIIADGQEIVGVTPSE